MGFTKLFSSLVTSSIWCEKDSTLRVWIAMLATCDARGVVEGSLPGFASLCRVSVKDMSTALSVLSSPDKDSRTKTDDGRRIEVCDGGWRILNYLKYREKGQDKEGSRAPYFREYQQKHPRCSVQQSSVVHDTEAEAEAEAEAERETSTSGDVPDTSRTGQCGCRNAPSLAELELQASKIGLPNSEAQAFLDYFESNGWKVGGKAAMRNWRGALSGWKRRWQERRTSHGEAQSINQVSRNKARMLAEIQRLPV